MTGNKKLDKILFLLNILVIVGVLSLVGYSHFFIEPENLDQSKLMDELKTRVKEDVTPNFITLKKNIINLPSTSSRLRFLEIEITVEPFHEEDSDLIKRKEYLINDAVINIAGKMKPDELNSITGKILLEGRLRSYLRDAIGDDIIKKLYFSRFIIQ